MVSGQLIEIPVDFSKTTLSKDAETNTIAAFAQYLEDTALLDMSTHTRKKATPVFPS